MHAHCMAKKIKRRMKKATRAYKMSYVLSFFLIVISIVAVITMQVRNARQEEKLEETSNHINTSQVVTENPIQTEVVSVPAVYASMQPATESLEILEKETQLEATEEMEEQEEVESKEAVISAYEPSDSYYYIVTNEERRALEKLVYQESRGEPYEGQVAVAAIVLNRYTSKDRKFDTSSIIAVIIQKGQFADISTVTQNQLDSAPSCKDAVDDALRGWDPTRVKFANGAKYFYEPNIVEGYQKEIREGLNVYQIGNHYFHENFDK